MCAFKERDITSYVLHKQHLLERSQGDQVLPIVEDLLALHATSASTPYLSLFARMKGFQRSDLDRELYMHRRLIRLEVMRGTLFITLTTLAPLLFQATRIPQKKLLAWLHKWSIPTSEARQLEDSILTALKSGGKTLPEIKNMLSPGIIRTLVRHVGKSIYRMTNVHIILTLLMRQGRVFSEKFSEPILTRHANRYALIREAYPQLHLNAITPEDAQIQLIKQYIGTFGPVTEYDIAWWTGLPTSKIRAMLTEIDQELHALKIKNWSDDYLMLKTDYTQFKKFKPPRRMPILLLPYEDPYTKGYKLRTRLIDSDNESKAYVGSSVVPTILLDGKIAGTWTHGFEERKEQVTLQPFQRLNRREQKTLIHQAKTSGEMMLNKDISVQFKTT